MSPFGLCAQLIGPEIQGPKGLIALKTGRDLTETQPIRDKSVMKLLAASVSNAKVPADKDPITLASAYELSQFNYFQRTTCDTLHALPTRLFV